MPPTTLTRVLRLVIFTALAMRFALHPAPAAAGDIGPQIGDAYQEQEHSQLWIQPAYTGCGWADTAAVNAAYEQRVLELVNQRRVEAGLPPLKRTAQLDLAARYHAKDMMDDNYFSHDSMDLQGGGLVTVCTFGERLSNYYPAWNYRAENIAAGYSTPESVMNDWMTSDGHRANILNSQVREIGIGFMQQGGKYGSYWVEDFGRSPDVYPVIINREAANSAIEQVGLFVYGQGVWNEMRLRNDSGAWSSWRAFQQTLIWTLPASAGQHTVSVELRKSGGSTGATSSDTIFVLGSLAGSPYRVFLPTIER